ncbi:MAG: ribbon-helix-helix protein, CopG family [Boseongicola sp. SB0676_bin_33]|nr:ribbon-helix-helix protein, CopG family [Boseongicola sp. SB0676_bin_33]
MHYVAFVHTDDAPGFGVSFPDFPGCVSQGDSLDEALRMAREALASHVEVMLAAGQAVREPSDVQQVVSDQDLAEWREGATLAYVPLILDLGSPKRVNVSIAPGLLKAIDDAARARGMNRSAFLASAARKEVAGSW